MEREQMRILFFFILMSSSAAKEVKNLTGTEGGNITLPDPVGDLTFLLYGAKTLAMVNQREMQIVEDIYKNRVLWNKDTGLFTITDLQRNDSGIYTVDSKKGRVFTTSHKVTVYEFVPAPAVEKLNVSSESCFLQCVVDKGEETKLLWYKDEEVVNQSSSALSLPLTVHKQDFSSSYRCVAASPAEEKSLSVNIKTICGQNKTSIERHNIIPIVIPIVFAVIVLLVALIIKQKYLHKNKWTVRETQGPDNTETRDVLYTDVHICENRRSQHVEDWTDSSATADNGFQLKTVYDKLEAHRMGSDYTELSHNGQD